VTSTFSSSIRVVGEVENQGTAAADNVQIVARFYTGDTLVATADTETILSRVFQNHTIPFRVFLSNAPAFDSYVLSVNWEDTSEFIAYEPLVILSQGVRDNYGIEIFGEVQNPSPATLSSPKLAVTFYDADGSVGYADYGYAASDELARQEVSTYQITTYRDINYDSYKVQGQGYYFP
jgi:hypothetical protein